MTPLPARGLRCGGGAPAPPLENDRWPIRLAQRAHQTTNRAPTDLGRNRAAVSGPRPLPGGRIRRLDGPSI